MKLNIRNIIILLLVILVVFLFYNLWQLFVYITLAAIISLILNPLNLLLKKIKYKKYFIPGYLRSIILLIFFWSVLFLAMYNLIPLIIKEIYQLASVNQELLYNKISMPLEGIRKNLYSLGLLNSKYKDLSSIIVEKFTNNFNIDYIQFIFSNLFSFIKSMLIGAFIVTFISFFFLKDERLFIRIILLFIPATYHSEVKHVTYSISKMLIRYFVGLIIDMICIFTLIFLGMLITGMPAEKAIIIAIIAAIFNIIPYVGPLISFSLGIIIGFLTYLPYNFNDVIVPHLMYISLVYIISNLLDASLIQPYIYSNAINAHPLEIFIIIISSGMIGGIIGMMIAIPSYMALRIIAKEFLYQFYIVKNLTKNV